MFAATILVATIPLLPIRALAQDGSGGTSQAVAADDASTVTSESGTRTTEKPDTDASVDREDDEPIDAGRAAEQEVEQDELDRWVPSFALLSGIVVEDGTAWVASNVHPANSATGTIAANGSTSFVSPFVVGSVEIMSPRFLERFAHPRAFAHIGVGGLFGIEKDIAKDGTPGKWDAPEPGPINNPVVVGGQGAVTRAQQISPVLNVGAGVAFTWDVGDKRLRVKPSLEYARERVEVSGLVHSAYILNPLPVAYDLVELSASRNAIFHGFGPGLAIEADVARWNSLVVAILASAQYYWIMSERDVDLYDETPVMPGTVPQLGSDTATADWHYTKGLHDVRALVGMRFRWAPAD